jgi:hypothetical protein
MNSERASVLILDISCTDTAETGGGVKNEYACQVVVSAKFTAGMQGHMGWWTT